VQAHTLREVGILGTILLRVYSGTTFPIFIEIGLYLTDKEQKISWHSFFLRVFECETAVQGHWFRYQITNRKRVFNFLLLVNSNLAPFQRYCMFPEKSDLTPIPPEFWGYSPWTRLPMLWLWWANYSCNYFRTNPTPTLTVHQRHGRTDGRTTYYSNTVQCT